MSLAGAHRLPVQIHVHEEALGVVGPLRAHQPVLEHLSALPLDQLLEGSLVVPGTGDALDLPAEDILLDDLPGRANTPVQIDRRQHGLHRVRLNGGTGTAAAGLLSLAQQQVGTQIQGLRHLHQALLAHQGGPHPGQLSLGQIGMAPVQVVGHHHAQDGVSQKFQPLIALQLAPALIGAGAVGQSVFQQLPVLKLVAQLFF